MRNVRPSFVKLTVDGRKSTVATGPRARSGQLSAEFLVRSHGSPLSVLDVACLPSADGGTVRLVVTDTRTGAIVFSEVFSQ